jgi:nicotinamide riboside kinase
MTKNILSKIYFKDRQEKLKKRIQNFIDIDPISTHFWCESYLWPSQNFIDIDPISTRLWCESYLWPSQNILTNKYFRSEMFY